MVLLQHLEQLLMRLSSSDIVPMWPAIRRYSASNTAAYAADNLLLIGDLLAAWAMNCAADMRLLLALHALYVPLMSLACEPLDSYLVDLLGHHLAAHLGV